MNLLEFFNAFLENAVINDLVYESDSEIAEDMIWYAKFACNGVSYEIDGEHLPRLIAEFRNNFSEVYKSENERSHAYKDYFSGVYLKSVKWS